MTISRKIAIVGLGYVGLSTAVAFAKETSVIGFDIKSSRITELQNNYDRNYEERTLALEQRDLYLTDDEKDLEVADFYIISVPTSITISKEPDLSCLVSASEIVGKNIKQGDIVVYESTVYPGTTEEECIPILERCSGLQHGRDFGVGYSPERINPGDEVHNLANTVKIIAGSSEDNLATIKQVYEQIVSIGTYVVRDIKTAEMVKLMENTQRDLNIAMVNEMAMICQKLHIDTTEVLNAAQTKWNFLSFRPGLVGGHCIGIDPYYLAHKAKIAGYEPDFILMGRRINNAMGKFIAERTLKNLISLGLPIKNSRVAILGLSFKENCADVRNTRIIDMLNEFKSYGVNVLVHDPVANPAEVLEQYNIELVAWEDIVDVQAIIIAVAHNEFLKITPESIKKILKCSSVLMDVKSIFPRDTFKETKILHWRL